MDSDIALALMEKARKVYGSEDTFLSFPLSPISFDEKDLKFFTDSDDDPTGKQSLNASAQFSRLVNLVPSGLTFPPSDERYLWDVYDNILSTSIIAMSDRSPEEEQQYAVVLDFLYDLTEDGLRVPSSDFVKYQEFNDANISLREQFNVEKIEAELSDSAEFKSQWTSEREPAWRERFEELETQWRNVGSKTRVEQALLRERSLSARSPARTWDEWSSRFDKDLDTVTDIQSMPFVHTSYLPQNAIHAGSWTEFTMSRQVAQQMIKEAPEALRTKLQGQASSVAKLKTLSFEYSSAKVDRFWFTPDLFDSRFFKYPGVISNGDTPAEGECSSYISGIVFARHINVELTGPSESTGTKPDKGNLATSVSFEFVDSAKAQAFRAQQLQIKNLRPFVIDREKFVLQPQRPVVSAIANAQLQAGKPVLAAGVKPMVGRLQLANFSKSKIRGENPTEHTENKAAATQQSTKEQDEDRRDRGSRARPGSATIRPATLQVSALSTSQRPSVSAPVKLRPGTGIIGPVVNKPQKPEKPVEQPAAEDESIYILAFICKKVSRCPNPDTAMQWDFV